MHWKHALVARVDARVHATPVDLPREVGLGGEETRSLDYLRVKASGSYLAAGTVLVRAATDLGTGYWVMVPLRLDDGRTIWANRGFVPAGTRLIAARAGVPDGRSEIVGLLRSSEPGGSLLQSNRPQDDRWYSRDVSALSLARRTGQTLPLFIDVQQEWAAGARGGISPVPGLTVVRFPDDHLQYALTWFAMAALSLVGLALVWRHRFAKSD